MGSIELVVLNDACVGCGFCAAHAPEAVRLEETDLGTFEARVAGPDRGAGAVCPFADGTADEDEIAGALYGDLPGVGHTPETGHHLALLAGSVVDEDTRLRSSSGGMITWLAKTMLERGMVDAVACVGPSEEPGPGVAYRLVRDPAELEACRKSRYHPVEVTGVIEELRRTDERVAFIGLPCFIKGLRLFLRAEPELAARVPYTIGLFCGHLKSKRYATYLSRTCGVEDDQVRSVDFRRKLEGRKASDYAVEVEAEVDGQIVRRSTPMSEVFGGRWGTNLFMLGACNWCDDVMAETADVAVGDAWIKPYADDYRGSSMVIIRHPELAAMVASAMEAGELDLASVSEQDVIRSQAGGLRQRREGLAYRLAVARRRGRWVPTKRTQPDASRVNRLFKIVVRLRERSRRTSHAAMRAQLRRPGVKHFHRRMWLWVTLLEALYVVRARLRR